MRRGDGTGCPGDVIVSRVCMKSVTGEWGGYTDSAVQTCRFALGGRLTADKRYDIPGWEDR